MIIRKLAVEDFRVFAQRHEFDLEPRKKYRKAAPIVLFGGLNGAGKTSILTAVLLALYGRQALGLGTSRKVYDAFLKESIHKSSESLIKKKSSKVELVFSFANMGIVTEYQVVRSWFVKRVSVSESLRIYENGSLIEDLSDDQAQAFLNELIPIGVSDLFFFDGEKIKDLAEDDTGKALADAIRKLLGLDLIQRLSADLTLLLREKEKRSGDKTLISKIEKKEDELKEIQKSANDLLEEFEAKRCSYIELGSELDRLNGELDAAGGAWAKSRDSFLKEHAEYLSEIKIAENDVRENLSGIYPLSLMGKHLRKIAKRVTREGKDSAKIEALSLIESLEAGLTRSIASSTGASRNTVKEAINTWRADTASKINAEGIRHDLSAMQRSRLLDQIEIGLSSKKPFQKNMRDLVKVSGQIEQIGVSLSRAPDEMVLKSQFDELRELDKKHGEIRSKLLLLREDRKKQLYQAIEVARELKALHDTLKKSGLDERAFGLGQAAKGMLDEFADKVTEERVKQLETEFTQSYARLARKEDSSIHAHIDPKSFNVILSDDKDQEINKNDLSAGEKQIYAIAILSALAKTSGRNLPVIIDTPLGRLDSKHREKLREHYFPRASQQVIILSTDTEVDEEFYVRLEKYISHSYLLEFDNTSKSTIAQKGYFWRNKETA